MIIKVDNSSWQFNVVANLQHVLKILDISKQDIPKKLQLKNWFQLFATLRNGTRGHGAILPDKYALAIPHLVNSLQLLISNYSLFKREWAFLYENLSGKYRVTKLNNNVNNFLHLKVSTSYAGTYQNGVYIFFDTITYIPLLFSNQDAEDFHFPNGAFRDKRYELISYSTGIRKEGDGSKYLMPTTELPSSETEGIGELYAEGNCLTNLPKLYIDYVNRQGLESNLLFILNQKDRYPIVTLVGRGGIGKTSIALKVIKDNIVSQRYDIIVWFSARDIDLTIDGPKMVKNKILNEFDIADEYCRLVGKDLPTKNEKLNYFASELTNSELGNTLFVFDNFETVGNPIELFSWIDTYIRNPNKVLITSRTSKSFKADYPIEITGMSFEECKELIQKTGRTLGIEELLSPHNIQNLINESNGHPYVIKILLGTIAKNKNFSKIERIIANQEDILIALFKRTYDILTPAAKRVFLTLCSWRSLIPQVALEAVLLRDVNERMDVEEAIEDLKRNSFIEQVSENGNNIFISVPLAASTFGRAELEVSPMKIEILADRDLLMEFGVTQQGDISAGLKPKLERKIRQIANRASKGEDISKHIQTIEYIAREYPRGWILLAELHTENRDINSAIRALNEFLKSNVLESEKKEVWHNLSNLYRHNGDYLGEVNALIEKCCLNNSSLFEISETANVINNYLSKDYFFESKLSLDIDVKSSLIQKIAEVMQRKIHQGNATDYSRLSWLYLHLNVKEKAVEMMNKGLEIDSYNPYCLKLKEKLER